MGARKTNGAIHSIVLWASGLGGLLVLATFLKAAETKPAPVAIVVNPSTPVDNLSLAEVRKVFLGERQFWNTNLRVVLLVRAPVARERDVALHLIYQMTEAQFRQYWIGKAFRAEVTAGPKLVYSNEMTNQLIPAIPGATAFEEADKVQPGEKVVRIDGKLPGERGYLLQ